MCGNLQPRSARAFTLVELMMGMAISAVTLTAVLAFTVYAAKSFAALENYVDLEQKTQNTLDTMTREIRQSQYLSNYSTATMNGRLVTNRVSFLDGDGDLLTYNYTNAPSGDGNNTVGVLMRTKAGVTTMMLTNVDYLSFQLYQRNPIGGSIYDQYQASTASPCKLVAVSWVCSRTILGDKLTTESVQTTKIIMRKQ